MTEYKELVDSAVQSLRNNKMRSLLTMLGIIIGISSVILIVSLGQGAVAFITDQLSSFGTNFFSINPGNSPISSFAGGQKTLTKGDADAIRNDTSLTNIQMVIANTAANVKVSANDTDKLLLVQGVDPQVVVMYKPTMVYGEFISDDDELEAKRVTVLGTDTAKTFFGEGTNPVGQKIQVDNKNFTVVGVGQSSNVLAGSFFNKSLFIPLSVSLHQLSGNVDVGEIDISVKNTDLINQTIQDVTAILRERHHLKPTDENDFVIQSFRDALSTVQTITNLLTTFVAAISAISLVVGGVGVMNIMLVSVTERTREIGLLKAIGALEKDILLQFLIESVVITAIGGAIGIVLGIGGAFLISLAVHIPFVLSVPAIMLAFGVSMLVGIVFGLYPARRAARLSPIDALRYE